MENEEREKVRTGQGADLEIDEGLPTIVIEETRNVAPDGGWGWCIVFGSFLCHFIIGGLERSSGLLYLYFQDRFQKSAAATAWATAIPSAVRLMLGPLCSFLCNKFSCRVVVITGSIIFTATLIMTAYAPTLEVVLFTFGFLGGFGRSLAYAPAVMIVGIYFNKRRGIAVGLSTSGVGFGSFVIPALVELAFHFYAFTGGFYILACFAIHICISGMLFRPLERQRLLMAFDKRRKSIMDGTKVPLRDTNALASHESLNENSKESNPKFKSDNSGYKDTENESTVVPKSKTIDVIREDASLLDNGEKCVSLQNGTVAEKNGKCCAFLRTESKSTGSKQKYLELSLLKDFRFLCFCLAILLFTLAFQSAFVFLPAYGKQIGATDMEAASLVIITGALDGVGRVLSGTILDLKNVKRFRVYIYNGVMFLVGGISFIIPFVPTYTHLCVVCGVYGILIGTYISQKSVILIDLLGAGKLINSFGLLISFQGVGMLIGPPFSGFLKDIDGRYENAFYVGGSSMFFGAVILLVSNLRHWMMSKKSNPNSQKSRHHMTTEMRAE
ncbi:monocarboxylate transporter 14-like [Ostrea edulis]|uniref:monocarboxylate transporter 14-like n=1 Tax=Ostrea edulis TaxID=37623 RepID=UPI0024AED2B6|nr:monocarboxylate transporter 14-like [Ostrea edulis]